MNKSLKGFHGVTLKREELGFPGDKVDKNPPAQGTQVCFLVWEDSKCCEATKPVSCNY